MSRLIAFGCSFTYGYGLEDCRPPPDSHIPPDTPSQYAWPPVAADLLGKHCVNNSAYGIGNKHIAYRVLNFEFEPEDIVVPMWTFFSRHSVIVDDNTVLDLHPSLLSESKEPSQMSDLDRAANDYYSSSLLSNQRNQVVENLMYVNLADLYLKSKNLAVVHATVPLSEYQGFNPIELASDQSKIKSLRQNYQKLLRDGRIKNINEYELALFACRHAKWFDTNVELSFEDTKEHGIMSDGHPSKESHRSFAQRLADHIKNG